MRWVLLVGVALNAAGALSLLPPRPGARGGEAAQLRLFAAGTAATFAALYLYLYQHPAHVVPFLAFGAALKTWACVLSAGLRVQGRLETWPFVSFGVTNGVVAVLFWVYLATV